MKVLFLNNYHYIRGGSERIFLGEMDMLKQHGHSTTSFARSHPQDVPAEFAHFFPPNIITDRIGVSWETFRTVKEIFYSNSARKGLSRLLSEYQPDIAHVHNIYGRLTSSVLDLLAKKKIPVVMTLHDYKLACPSYLFLCNGNICEDCKGGRFYRAIGNRCHKGSYAASAIVALESYMNSWLQKYRKKTDLLISPSRFLKNKLTQCGWSEDKIRHVDNFIDLKKFEPKFSPGRYFLFLGRLSEEKGLKNLLQAFNNIDRPQIGLAITGEGPLRNDLERMAKGNSAIKFTGYLSGEDLKKVARNSLAVVVPSLCYENAPLSVLEAMAFGKPVIGARIGGIPEMITDGHSGFLFESGNSQSLRQALERISGLHDHKIESMGMAARESVERLYCTEAHYKRLMTIYKEVLDLTVDSCKLPTSL